MFDKRDTGDDYSPYAERQAAQVIQIDSGKHMVVIAICAAFCGIALAVSVWAAFAARDAETESRLTQYFLQDPASRTPEELSAWSKFRLEHMKEEQ